jgi:7,8-dihydropterin-6-yl-methyl-4-(beta-D-ribofuranosyl)aminobenzene 5'-phosphate synthase
VAQAPSSVQASWSDWRNNIESIIPQTVEALGKFNLSVIAAGHCTGWRAMIALANAFGDSRLAPLAVGHVLAL